MTDYRINTHPILPIPTRETIEFTWMGQPLQAQAGETIATRCWQTVFAFSAIIPRTVRRRVFSARMVNAPNAQLSLTVCR